MEKTIVDKLSLHKYKTVAILNIPEGTEYFNQLTNYTTTLNENQNMI